MACVPNYSIDYLLHRHGIEHSNRLTSAALSGAIAGNGHSGLGMGLGLGASVTPYGDNPSLSASLQASLSENSALPPFLRNLVGGPLSRSTSASPPRSPSDSPSMMRSKYSHSADEDGAGHANQEYHDNVDDEYEEDCDLDEVQDLSVASKHHSPSARSVASEGSQRDLVMNERNNSALGHHLKKEDMDVEESHHRGRDSPTDMVMKRESEGSLRNE